MAGKKKVKKGRLLLSEMLKDCGGVTNQKDFWDSYCRRVEKNNVRRYREVIRDSTLAIRINRRDFYAYMERGRSYKGLNQYQKAIADFNQAIGIKPERASPYSARAGIYAECGKPRKAIEDYTQAIKAEPGYATLCYALRGSQYERVGQYKEALDDYEKYLELDTKQKDRLRWDTGIIAGVSPIRRSVHEKITTLRIKLMNRKK